MPAKVLDSFALIAYFRDEPGSETMEELLVAAGKKDTPLHMTGVNYAEVKYSIVKKEGAEAWAEAAKILQGLPIDFHSTNRALVDTAADLGPASESVWPAPSPPHWQKKRKATSSLATPNSSHWKSKSTG